MASPINVVALKEELFILEYLKDLNPRMAAVRAGFPSNLGSKLLRKPTVKIALEKAMAARAVRVGLSADRVLERLGLLTLGDKKDCWNDVEKRWKTLDEMTPDEAALVVGARTQRKLAIGDDGEPCPIEVTEYKFVDPVATVQLAMRHFGLFKDSLTVEVTSLAMRMQAAQARMKINTPEQLKIEAPVIDAQSVAFEIDGVHYDAEGNELERAEDYI